MKEFLGFKKNRGVTMFELLVVITIVGILASYSTASYDRFIINNQMSSLATRLAQGFKRASFEAQARSTFMSIDISTFIFPVGSGLTAQGWFVTRFQEIDADGLWTDAPDNAIPPVRFSGTDENPDNANIGLENEFNRVRLHFPAVANCNIQQPTINPPVPNACTTLFVNSNGGYLPPNAINFNPLADNTNSIDIYICAPNFENEEIRRIVVFLNGTVKVIRLQENNTNDRLMLVSLRSQGGDIGDCFL